MPEFGFDIKQTGDALSNKTNFGNTSTGAASQVIFPSAPGVTLPNLSLAWAVAGLGGLALLGVLYHLLRKT